jgi:hypothetical protein
MLRIPVALLAALPLLATSLPAQANKVAGRDATLPLVESFRSYWRAGTYPNGTTGASLGVTVCNVGTGNIGWNQPMNPDHPMYAPLVVRLADDRLEQISDWSHVKHGFLSINANFCGTCSTSNGSILGPNCSDTYGSGLNADRYWLGPPSEIDPWLGAWDSRGSLFDRGMPDVGSPRNNDNSRSLTRSQANALPSTMHRIQLQDQDLLVQGARYFYGMYIVVAGEPGDARENNWCFREANPAWTGSSWSFSNLTNSVVGSPLNFWTGATVTNGGNQGNDGFFYVGVKVTGPDARGFWHYEYAVHNRDNSRGGASFRVPVCSTARIENLRFRDIDGDATNDWTAQAQNGEVAFFAPATGNVLEWNTLYNFSFDADVAPTSGTSTIDQARTGTGGLSVSVLTTVPGTSHTPVIGDGCGATPMQIHANGIPTIPNPGFAFRIEDVTANSSAVLLASWNTIPTNAGNGCTLFIDPANAIVHGTFGSDGQGIAQVPFAVPNDPSLEGVGLTFQAVELVTGGPLYGLGELSNALRMRIGNQVTGCQ